MSGKTYKILFFISAFGFAADAEAQSINQQFREQFANPPAAASTPDTKASLPKATSRTKEEAERIKAEAAKLKAEAETERVKAEKAAADARAEAEAAKRAVAEGRNTSNNTFLLSLPPDANAAITNENAAAINKRIGELAAQITLLQTVQKEQSELKKSSNVESQPAIEATISAVDARINKLKAEYNERDKSFSKYLTSIKPNDRDLYLTARKASEIYPKIPFYIPGTNETGEFWIEPTVSDRGEMNFVFKFIDIQSTIDKVRSKIDMTLSEVEDAQKALIKVYEWSAVAHKQKIRKNFEKRVTCFPVSECPPDGERIDGKASTEIRFNIYEDGSTAGRIQRNKGRFVEGYNVSIDSAMLLQAYLNHVIKEAKLEFSSGTQDKKSLDKLFQ